MTKWDVLLAEIDEEIARLSRVALEDKSGPSGFEAAVRELEGRLGVPPYATVRLQIQHDRIVSAVGSTIRLLTHLREQISSS